jgi:hypothetical protein
VAAHVLDAKHLELVAAARSRSGGDQIDLVPPEVDVRQVNRASGIVPFEHVQ